MPNHILRLVACVVAAALVACGGGTGDEQDTAGAARGEGSGAGDTAQATAPAGGVDAGTPGAAPQSVSVWTVEDAGFAFMSNRGGDTEIYLSSGVDGPWTNLTNHAGADNWPVWSPDGARIAFQSSREDKLDIYVMNADGTGVTRLTDHPEHDYLPAWSPDGTQLTFASWRREPGDTTQANHIYIMNADGSDQRRLFPWSPGTSTWAVWSPDAQTFVLAREFGGRKADIVIVDRDGNTVRALTNDDAANGAPVFSPDGRYIAYHADHGNYSKIVVIDVDGGNRRELVTDGLNWYPDWSPDGRFLMYTGNHPGSPVGKLEILAVPVDGGNPFVLVEAPDREAEGRWRPMR